MESKTPFEKLLALMLEKTGLDCRKYNEPYIKRRLNSRFLSNGLGPADYEAYIKILGTVQAESRELYNALTVNVTQFFRDAKMWEVLRTDVLPKIIAKLQRPAANGKRPGPAGAPVLNVWSCGCSSGEEPYSLAILLKELAGARQSFVPAVIATDIDDLSLERAASGIYGAASLATAPAEYVARYFKRTEAGAEAKFELDSSVKSLVRFRKHNFFDEPAPVTGLDLILCRNVFIYFKTESKDKLLQTFHAALKEDGFLVMGKSEVLFTANFKDKFFLYNSDERIYGKGECHG